MRVDLCFSCDYGQKDEAVVHGVDPTTLEVSCSSVSWEGGYASLYSPDHTMGHVEYEDKFYDHMVIVNAAVGKEDDDE